MPSRQGGVGTWGVVVHGPGGDGGLYMSLESSGGHAHHGEPLHGDLRVVQLPLGGEACEEGRAGEVVGSGRAEGGEGFFLDVLEKLEGCRAEAAVAIDDEGGEGAAQINAMGAVLRLLVTLTLRHGPAGREVDVGGGVGVDTGEVEEDAPSGHEDLSVRKEVGQVLLDDVGEEVVASGELAEKVAGAVVADWFGCA